ncbi:hypothetical protein ACH5RR_033069 [Cinchona calisaya]|uniref:C2H2-type domain-containing protein n=1 Tax=Cinchona calisaya TaxID=153742 RepID=A0ABD2YJW9_9GENT
MEAEKHGNSETSIEEIDQPEKLMMTDYNAGIGRSYECNFCKRGFTNAQALGGHMNIHRKDKAKAKDKLKNNHQQDQSSLTNKSHEDYNNTSSKYFAPISNEKQQYTAAMAPYTSYQLYFPTSNNSFLHGYHQCDHDLPSPRPEYRMDRSLSLRIGPPRMEDGDERKIISNEDEVDLELRLGHQP